MALELDSLVKIENELEAVRDQMEDTRGIPNISIGSLNTSDADVFQRLERRERKLERLAVQAGSASISAQSRRSVGGTGGSGGVLY